MKLKFACLSDNFSFFYLDGMLILSGIYLSFIKDLFNFKST